MDEQIIIGESEEVSSAPRRNFLPVSIVAVAVILAFAWIYTAGLKTERSGTGPSGSGHEASVAPTSDAPAGASAASGQAAELPAAWGDLGARMIEAGVIDRAQFEALYAARGGLTEEEKKLLSGSGNGKLVVTQANSGSILNLLWALGLSNRNSILEQGPMTDPRYGDAGRFASTGGWTLAKGSAMDHFSKHQFLALTAEEQELVERVSRNIYRPCCDNATYFPDCNHGMAMLGLLELLASQGASEEQMYRAALQVNSFWFPNEYATIARYLTLHGVAPASADPKLVLGVEYSSASGYQRIAAVTPKVEEKGAGGCGV